MLTGSLRDDLKHQLRYGNIVAKLIIANAAVFLVLGMWNAVSYFLQVDLLLDVVTKNIYAPAAWDQIIRKPWTVFTYQFAHIQFLHVLFNMLWLYWFGEIFVLYLGEKRVLPLYFTGGVVGWFVFALAINILPVLKPAAPYSLLLGASASIEAIVFAAVTLHPSHRFNLMFFGEVKILYIALIGLLLDFIAVPDGNAGTFLSHLGGALWGVIYIKFLQAGTDVFSPLEKLSGLFARKSTMRVTHVQPGRKSNTTVPTDEQKRVDELLDKISRSGYDSLTKEEKDFLFHYSNK